MRNSFNTTVVSVEYGSNNRNNSDGDKFQYNCCFGGIFTDTISNTKKALFQYNCCFGGIH